MRAKTLVFMKLAITLLCFSYIYSGDHPPALAQEEHMSAVDAVQSHDIAQINEHLRNTDATVEKQRVDLNANSMAISEAQGEQRAFAVVLGALSTVSIVIQVKKKTA